MAPPIRIREGSYTATVYTLIQQQKFSEVIQILSSEMEVRHCQMILGTLTNGAGDCRTFPKVALPSLCLHTLIINFKIICMLAHAMSSW